MTSTYYFAGHETLANRGCEALLRGISAIVREEQPGARFLAPSFDRAQDGRQWADAAHYGVEFVDAYRLPRSVKAWSRLHAKVPAVRRLWLPQPSIPADADLQAREATAGIMTGGDVLSLDYSVASLIKYMGQAETFIRRNQPMILWAASVGPFSKAPDIERRVVAHLARYAHLSVRESASLEYLNSLGLRDVKLVADPAFVMRPEPFDVSDLLPQQTGERLLGFNLSPLIRRILAGGGAGGAADMEASVCEFLSDVMLRTRCSLLLIPHVDTVDGKDMHSDYLYMQGLLRRAQLPAARVSVAPRSLNAAQIKHLLSKCDYFMGARTHATIGALSMGVPTVSLGYSVKARGLNRDLFGDERYVLDTKKMTKLTLWKAFESLRTDADAIRSLLAQRIPEWRERARSAFIGI